jgi:hypothetical protein
MTMEAAFACLPAGTFEGARDPLDPPTRDTTAVAKRAKHVASDPPERGWAELRDGRWAAARTRFEEALAEAESPGAFEGLRDFLDYATRSRRGTTEGSAEYPYEYLLVIARTRGEELPG